VKTLGQRVSIVSIPAYAAGVVRAFLNATPVRDKADMSQGVGRAGKALMHQVKTRFAGAADMSV
jgi:hypothetical protein